MTMLKPFRLPGDPAKTIKGWLASQAWSSPVPDVGMGLPADWSASSSGPYIGIFDDGGPDKWPVTTEPRVRVTVWANGRDQARSIASRCKGLLLSYRVPGVSTITGPTTLLEDRDPINGGHMCSFTVAAQARTIAG